MAPKDMTSHSKLDAWGKGLCKYGQDLTQGHPGLIMGLKSTGKGPFQGEKKGRRPSEDGDRDWSYVA